MVTWRIKLGWDYLPCGHNNILCVQGISMVMGGIKMGLSAMPCEHNILCVQGISVVMGGIKMGLSAMPCGHNNILCVQGISVVMGGIKLVWDCLPYHEDVTTSCVFRESQWWWEESSWDGIICHVDITGSFVFRGSQWWWEASSSAPKTSTQSLQTSVRLCSLCPLQVSAGDGSWMHGFYQLTYLFNLRWP